MWQNRLISKKILIVILKNFEKSSSIFVGKSPVWSSQKNILEELLFFVKKN